jgi:tetratricopeptide (TPR) repeat protein
MERYEAALQDFNQAIELDPKYSWAIANRGQTYRAMERYEEALKDFNQAIELDPKGDWAIVRRVRGELYLMVGRAHEALSDFNRSIELKPESDWGLYCRALAYRRLNQPDNATADLERAIQLAHQSYTKTPDDHRNTFNLALYYLAADKLEQSKHFYRDALNRAAPPVRIREAIRDLGDFLTVFPGHQAAQTFKQALEKRVNGKQE